MTGVWKSVNIHLAIQINADGAYFLNCETKKGLSNGSPGRVSIPV